MTRINVVPVEELCDQHLLAEHRELTRIPNCVARGRYSLDGQPKDYTLGPGHVKFFYDKLSYLKIRYNLLHTECKRRGFNVKYIWPNNLPVNAMWNHYTPTDEALAINRARIQERMPKNARFS